MPAKKKDESLEESLASSATKKGLSGADKRQYIGGAITNMRKKGELPARTGAKKATSKAKGEALYERLQRGETVSVRSPQGQNFEVKTRKFAGVTGYVISQNGKVVKEHKGGSIMPRSEAIEWLNELEEKAEKAAAPAPKTEPNHKEAYLERKRKERAEQDKKDYERIMEKREPAWSLSGHDRAVLKREGARREKEYKAKQAELERARKEQKKQAQEEKHSTLYNAGKKPVYVVYAAKYQGEKPQPVAEFKTQASASNHAYKLRQKGYAHTEYKNEYKGPEKPKEPTYDVTIIKHPGSLSGHARREVKDLTASEVQSLLNSTPTSIYKNFKVYKAGTGEIVRSATGTKDDPYWKLSRKRG